MTYDPTKPVDTAAVRRNNLAKLDGKKYSVDNQVAPLVDVVGLLGTQALLLCDILDELRRMNAAPAPTTDCAYQRWASPVARCGDGISGTDGAGRGPGKI